MSKNMYEAMKEQSAYPPAFEYHIGPPFIYKSVREKTTPIGYENSDLKQSYLDKINARNFRIWFSRSPSNSNRARVACDNVSVYEFHENTIFKLRHCI